MVQQSLKQEKNKRRFGILHIFKFLNAHLKKFKKQSNLTLKIYHQFLPQPGYLLVKQHCLENFVKI